MAFDTHVRLLIGANAYACITECGVRFDVKLNPGRSAKAALADYVAEQEARALVILENAARAKRAIAALEAQTLERKAILAKARA